MDTFFFLVAIGKERRFYSEDKNKFLEDFCKQRLTYGNIEGNPEFKAGVCKLYKTIKLDEIIPTHGATGANHHVFYSLISPGERVISIRPTYQQLYSIPESYGADVQLIDLKKENGYLPDIEEIRRLATPETKMPIDSYTFCEEMYKQTGAFVTPGDCFEQSHSMRIGYACDAEILKAGLCAVSEYIKMKLKVN